MKSYQISNFPTEWKIIIFPFFIKNCLAATQNYMDYYSNKEKWPNWKYILLLLRINKTNRVISKSSFYSTETCF